MNHFVLSCLTSQRCRAVKRATWGGAQVIGNLDFCWQHLHMDWTVGLPASKLDAVLPDDSIHNFVDHLSGMCRFVPARAKDSAKDTEMHLINNVIRLHGCPERIIADNVTRFRVGLWQALTRRLGVTMKHTSTNNPRANGKVENTHATLYDILRSIVSR